MDFDSLVRLITENIPIYEKLLADTLDWLVKSLDWLGKSGWLQLASVLIAISAFFIQYYRDRNNKKVEFRDRLKRASSLILLDLSLLETRGKEGGRRVVVTSEGEYDGEYVEDHISTEHYQSLVYSGLITYFQKDTQFEVTHFYHHITLHNKRIFDLNDMSNSRLNSGKFREEQKLDLEASIAWKDNQKELVKYDKEITEKIPIVKKLLNDELIREK